MTRTSVLGTEIAKSTEKSVMSILCGDVPFECSNICEHINLATIFRYPGELLDGQRKGIQGSETNRSQCTLMIVQDYRA